MGEFHKDFDFLVCWAAWDGGNGPLFPLSDLRISRIDAGVPGVAHSSRRLSGDDGAHCVALGGMIYRESNSYFVEAKLAG